MVSPAILSSWTRRRLDAVALAGLAVLLAAAAFDAWVLGPAETRLHALQEAFARRSQPMRAETVSSSLAHEPAGKLEAFYGFFRRDLRPSDWLARIHDVADRTGVRPQQADYRLLDDRDARLLRYEVALPLTGDYGRIRSFAEGVLNAVPVASLDHIAFRRQRASQGEVEAELRFTLYISRAE